jgi:hypothetical protein
MYQRSVISRFPTSYSQKYKVGGLRSFEVGTPYVLFITRTLQPDALGRDVSEKLKVILKIN